jgi:uncharacterized protein involved in exopolysaccharide biosynthesis
MAMNLPFEIPSIGGLTVGPSDIYIAIMRSRNVRENIIKKFDLKDYFEVDYIEDALQALDGITEIDKTEENFIVVKCTERSPEFAQQLVSAYLDELDRVNREVRHTSATYTREFIEKRLQQAEKDLQDAADRLVEFQKKYGVIDLENQVKAQIEITAQLRSQLILAEIERDVLQHVLSSGHSKLKSIELRVAEMQAQLQKLSAGAEQADHDLILAVNDIPELGKKYLFLQRDIEVQKTIYQLLMQQYEQAKIQEAKDSPTIQVLDPPSLAQKRTKPKRAIIVITSAIVSFFLSLLIIWIKEFPQNLQKTDPEKYDTLIQSFRRIHKFK